MWFLRAFWNLIVTALILTSAMTHACEPADEGPIFAKADAIFVGRLVEYQIEYFSTGERSAGLLTYEVEEDLLGQSGDRITVRWLASFGGRLTDEMSAPENELVGVILPGSDAHKDYWSGVTHLPMVAHEPMLVTGGCGDRLRVSATQKHIEAVKAWIATGEPTGISRYTFVTAPSIQITARTIRFWRWTGLIVGLTVLSLVVAIFVSLRRYKRAKT